MVSLEVAVLVSKRESFEIEYSTDGKTEVRSRFATLASLIYV